MKRPTRPEKWDYLITESVRVLGITREAAAKRLMAVFASDILKEGHPEDKWTQLQINTLMQMDTDNMEYGTAFRICLRYSDLIKYYDRNQGQHLAATLTAIGKGTYDMDDVREQIERFDLFFCKYIWNKYHGVQRC